VLEGVKVRGPVGPSRTRADAVAADTAYSARANRAWLRRRRIKAVIPEKADQAAHRKGHRGGRPGGYDAELYRGATPQSAASTRSRRGAEATRYDKTPQSYLAGLHLRGAIIWLRSLQPTT
jgi:transposase